MSAQIILRLVKPADAERCGQIIYDAFAGIAALHNFPPDFPSPEAAVGVCRMFAGAPAVYGVVAEVDGKIVGSNFLDERDAIRGVGPITIDPAFQGQGIGRRLMQDVMERGRGAAGIRLVQDAANTVSMPLYASLGFEVKEPLVLMTGKPKIAPASSDEARALTAADLPQCAELCRRIHGFDRAGELKGAIKMFALMGLFRAGRLVAYLSAPTFWPLNHGVGESEKDLTDLLAAAGGDCAEPLALLIPIRRAGLFRWCLNAGLRVIKPMTLMAMGEYHEPAGAFYPSVGY